ncbi:protein NYNRIN-like [Eleutherodactylus coqui]|uniref:protein NYNRIN-like n=1 Tax=Eleutherodactylus coqui TaxID=57060 RepID=UPI003461AD44
MQPLFDVLIACNKGQPFQLTVEAQEGFQKLKTAIVSAPALGLPNYDLSFNLFCHEIEGHAKGVLTQQHGSKQRPIGYYSVRLDTVVRGAPSCIRAIAACAVLKEKVADMVLEHPLVVQVPHAVQEVLSQVTTKHLSMARLTKYEVALLTPPNLTIKRCTALNPATLLPDVGEKTDEDNDIPAHDCIELMHTETKPLDNVSETPIPNADLELFVDGSRFYQDGRPHTGYAIVSQHEVLKGESLPSSMSAQEAELTALAEACSMAEHLVANIYTDSQYCFGICHDYLPLWRARNFTSSSGKPVKNAPLVAQLLRALELPKKVGIIKVRAHTKERSPEALGNQRADLAAKAAALLPLPNQSYCLAADVVLEKVDIALLSKLQNQASDREKEEWARHSGSPGEDGLWKVGARTCLPRVLHPMMCALSHGPTHQSKDAMFHSRSILTLRNSSIATRRLGASHCKLFAGCQE